MRDVTICTTDPETGAVTTCQWPYDAALGAITIRDLLKDIEPPCEGEEPTTIPVPNLSGETLLRVTEFVTHHHAHPNPEYDKMCEAERRAAEMVEWDKDFVTPLKMSEVFDLIMAANYLDLKPLLELSAKRVAQSLKGKSEREIFALFGVDRDMTEEEREKVKQDHPWLYD